MSSLFYIIGKSSTGKDTIYKELCQKKELNLRPLVMYTTRPIRDMEEEGRAYDEINEEISINDINEGDVVSVIYNDDGSAAEISIMSMTRREK